MFFSKKGSLIPAHILVLAVVFSVFLLPSEEYIRQRGPKPSKYQNPNLPPVDRTSTGEPSAPEETPVDPTHFENNEPLRPSGDPAKNEEKFEFKLNLEEGDTTGSINDPDAYNGYTSIDHHTDATDGGPDIMAYHAHGLTDTTAAHGNADILGSFASLS